MKKSKSNDQYEGDAMRRRRHSTNNSNPENPGVVRNLPTDALSPDNKAAEEILKSANAAAGTIRNLFISYILLAVYILIIVGSTNDEQLLRDSGVAVPFLSNITLPVSYFISVRAVAVRLFPLRTADSF